MKTKFQSVFGSLLIALSISFSACDGDQGEIGPAGPKGDAGTQGIQGEKGDSGDTGEQGEKGDGYSEAISFGNIIATISGTHTDTEYSVEQDFKYLPSGSNLYYSEFNTDVDGRRYFNIGREYKISAPANGKNAESGGTMIRFRFVENNGEVTPQNFDISTTVIHDLKYFEVSSYHYFEEEIEVDFVVSNFNFDETTGKLTMDVNYSFTNYDETTITVSCSYNVIVLEGVGVR